MPGRNIVREDTVESYYHVYARGVNRQQIFLDESDYVFFTLLFKRYLSPSYISNQRQYQKIYGSIHLISYCLVSNHFHLLVYQIDQQAMAHLMRPLLTSFSMYFNKKYERSGPLFKTRYRASRISSDSYLVHITRYIHLNPEKWQTYRHSSLSMYTGKWGEDRVDPSPILKLFSSKTEYLEFLKNYKEERAVLDKLKHELAHL